MFFRSKADIHTTRSRWFVGLVIDFDLYEHYLSYVDQVFQNVNKITEMARQYFDKLKSEDTFRRGKYAFLNIKIDDRVNLKIDYYHRIFKAQQNELRSLREIHNKNWVDFSEILGVGHSELEQSRQENREHVRPKRFIGLAAGIFSGIAYFETRKLRSEVDDLKRTQNVIRHVLLESLSPINVTRMEVEENRHTINQIINKMDAMVEAWQRSVSGIVNRLVPLERFTLAYAQTQKNINTVRDLVTAETVLFTHLHAKISKLSTQKLSPNLLPAPELVKILKSIEVELPPQLMLPRDPREAPWYYYTILKTNTVALGRQLIVTIEIPLLDVTQRFRVKEAISLPVPFETTNLTGEYELEFKHFAVSADGRQYVVLTWEDQINCGRSDINFCTMTSAVYEMNHHQYCTLALFQKDLRKIKNLCKTRVTNKLKLPIARYITRGQWLVATNRVFYLRKLCVKTDIEERIAVEPPFNVITLESGCRALADKLELPIYFEERSEYKVERESRITNPIKGTLTNLPIWAPLEKHHFNVSLDLETLPPIDPKNIDELVHMLEETKTQGKFQFSTSNLPYVIIAIIVLLVLVLLGIVCMKRHLIMNSLSGKILKTVVGATSLDKSETVTPSHPKRSTTTRSATSSHMDNELAEILFKPGAQVNGGAHVNVNKGAQMNPAPALANVSLEMDDLGQADIGRGPSRSLSPSAKPRARTTLRLSARRGTRVVR